ncbi:DMT family transporter [Afifella marina]|uniref:EamA domain-containing protein n=1 Tax=Afifella marina DSM 2698 TaxID=1120955 RepID=A0A1G5MG36_AFIMA|nr:DMT family transporter [Afifella marina]MBK1625361.1 EamA family transporter [Afifella marina DSM 2698]MBK1629024.1 EamA family transporter [Afifella marina]MBK5916904.1 EamA family transporter [Afifella marina]RAI22797.1 EamA family transporter [Afifella marina DSM 2698]SCZ24123.1 hypothetical protein SAMN03080610_00647 [Afifella marina DSM 2698]
MDNHVFAAVILAALLHAGWNSVVKVGLDRVSTILLLAIAQAAIAACALPFVARPAAASLPMIAAAAALHAGYKLFLIEAYARADLSQAYPLARGAAPIFVTVISVLFLDASFAPSAFVAIGAISAGILLMAAKGSTSGRMDAHALFFALGTAGFTASYTLVDGLGARVADTPSGFVLWMVIGDAALLTAFIAVRHGRSAFVALRPAWKSGVAAGAMSLGSYWIAVWAFTQAPIALVAALRESSILFAALIAAFVLREPVSRWRWISAACIACGLALMKA